MLRLIAKYISYWVTSKNAHGIHSPFVYNLYTKVIKDTTNHLDYKKVEALRHKLLKDETTIQLTDYGAGGEARKEYSTTIKILAKKSAKPKKYSQLLYRLCNYHQPKYALELGTSLGISAAYQVLGANQNLVRFTTIEGSEAVANVAKENFKTIGIENKIESRVGNFDDVLQTHLNGFEQLDYVFFDGNHRYQPTMDYFSQCLPLAHENTLFVFDDIRWSKEMEQAWEEIKNHPSVTVTIDLFFVGLVYFKKGQAKQHFVLRY